MSAGPEDSGRPEDAPEPSPLFPPAWWLARVNASRGPGTPMLTSLDPLAMLLWHTCSRPPEGGMLHVTGC